MTGPPAVIIRKPVPHATPDIPVRILGIVTEQTAVSAQQNLLRKILGVLMGSAPTDDEGEHRFCHFFNNAAGVFSIHGYSFPFVLPALRDCSRVLRRYFCSTHKQKLVGIGIPQLKIKLVRGSVSCTFETHRFV